MLLARLHERHAPLAELFVGDGHHHRLLDAVMVGQRPLDFLRVDGLAAGEEPVVATPDDRQVPLVIHVSQVPGGEPAIAGHGTLQAPALDIAHEQRLAGQLDLPLIADPEPAVRQQLSRGEPLGRGGINPRGGDLRGHLRASITGEHRQPAFARPAQKLQRNRAPAQNHVPEGRVTHGRGLLQQSVQLRHHHRQMRNLVTLQDRVKGLTPVRHHHGRPRQQAPEEDAEPAHVIERQVQQPAVSGGQRQVPVTAEGVVVVIAIGMEHRLGDAGAAGGKDDGSGAVERHGGTLCILLQGPSGRRQVTTLEYLHVAREVAEPLLIR